MELKRPRLGAWPCGAWGRGVEEDGQISSLPGRGEHSLRFLSFKLAKGSV